MSKLQRKSALYQLRRRVASAEPVDVTKLRASRLAVELVVKYTI